MALWCAAAHYSIWLFFTHATEDLDLRFKSRAAKKISKKYEQRNFERFRADNRQPLVYRRPLR
jgi:hypothetical protein